MTDPGYIVFVPIARASGWTTDDGDPQIWWWARLEHDKPVLLSDGTDARKLDAVVSVSVGADALGRKTRYTVEGDQVARLGHISYDKRHSRWIDISITVSRESFRCIQPLRGIAGLPTLNLGFGSGEIGVSSDASHPLIYHWDNTVKPVLNVKTCRLRAVRAVPDADDPTPLEKAWHPPRAARILGLVLTAVTNIVAVVIGVAIFSVATTNFETAILSVLLLIYVGAATSSAGLGRVLLQMNIEAGARFSHLRELAGTAQTPEERKFLVNTQQNAGWLDAHQWINTVGCGIIATIAVYKLIRLFW